MPTLDDLLARLWDDYSRLNPDAGRIHELFRSRGEKVRNDHIALRTFDDPRVGLDVVTASFRAFGYEPRAEYVFPEKHLFARHYEHADPDRPLVFASELRLGDMSRALRSIVAGLLDQMPPDLPTRWDFPVAGRPWRLSTAEYEQLRSESEYAAWVAAFGFRANHFTVSVNALESFAGIADLSHFLEANGFLLNRAGGVIKGSPQEHLEQSSTLAGEAEVEFSDGVRRIPACYYEFAHRYPLEDGRLFRGFIEKSADRIFESTDRRR